LIPTELMIQERVQEHEREANHYRLVSLVTTQESLADRLRKFGAAVFGGEQKPTTDNKN
jgi:hypothetical protein